MWRGLGLAMATVVAALGVAAAAHGHGPGHAGAFDAAGAPALGATNGGTVFDRPLTAVAAGPAPVTTATILSVSDFHGRLNPTTFRIDVEGQKFSGAAYLQTYFKQRAALAPNPPFLVTQGDAVGATQPVSGLLGDRPTIDVMNRMGFDADTLGNHNFDDGVANMRDLARQAAFPYLVTNLTNRGGQRLPWTKPWAIWPVGGTRIGVTGAINEDAADLLKPGSLGELRVGKAADGINAAARELRARGVNTVVALAHVGALPTKAGPNGPTGPLIDLAKELRGVDVLLGDHTYWQVNQPIIGRDNQPVWVVQSVPNGVTFSEVRLAINELDGEAVGVAVDQFPTTTNGITPDPEIAALVKSYNDRVEPITEQVIGSSTEPIPSSGTATDETKQGNVVTDALRAATGTQLALYNTGGLRDALTRGDRDASGNYPIRRGDVLAMLPFNNQMTTLTLSGAELKAQLENGIGEHPTPSAAFPQISGFSFKWNPMAQPNGRVKSGKLADGTPIDFSPASRYTLVTNDFVATGGDGYTDFSGRLTYQGDVEDAVIAYLQARPGFNPPGPPEDLEQRIEEEPSLAG